MNWSILVFLFTLLMATHSVAQPIKLLTLTCPGKFSNFELQDVRDITIIDALVKINNDFIDISGVPSFGVAKERYNITSVSESRIDFIHPADKSFTGNINRYTGTLNLLNFSSKATRTFSQSYQGTCAAAQRIF